MKGALPSLWIPKGHDFGFPGTSRLRGQHNGLDFPQKVAPLQRGEAQLEPTFFVLESAEAILQASALCIEGGNLCGKRLILFLKSSDGLGKARSFAPEQATADS